ncbi:threonine-phosphate decarboxylase CobD [Roseibium sp.]|uniref:threonine-phosphate decarboxylase CobD n=1 Tax=Roseibium sp. TaxID=1936156 RepID=UPI003A972FD2
MKHGGDLTTAMHRFGGPAEDWLDLSTGINPHAYPVPEALARTSWTSLPSQEAHDRLIRTARAAYACPDHLELVVAPGTQILISQLADILPDGPVAICGPTYSSHAEAFARAGRQVEDVSSPHALPDHATIAVIVNPNNPDGRLVDVTSLKAIAASLQQRGGVLVIDEAFADAVPGSSVLPHLNASNVVVLRSFGKFFGLAGLRLGFMVATPELAAQMENRLDSWAVSGPALEIGALALADAAWQSRMVNQLADEMADLTLALGQAGLTVFGGTPLYALAACRNAHMLHEALAQQRIWTRVFDYAPTWIRLGLPPSRTDNERLIQALAAAASKL